MPIKTATDATDLCKHKKYPEFKKKKEHTNGFLQDSADSICMTFQDTLKIKYEVCFRTRSMFLL